MKVKSACGAESKSAMSDKEILTENLRMIEPEDDLTEINLPDLDIFEEESGKEELVLIAISESTNCPRVIRAAMRLAKAIGAPAKAVYVERKRLENLGERERRSIEENIRLAKALGAGIVFAYGSDIPRQLIETANVTGATKLFIGLSGKRTSAGNNIGVQIKKRMPSLDVYIIPGAVTEPKAEKVDINAAIREKTYRGTHPFILFLSLIGVLSVCTLLSLAANYFGIPYVDIVIIYLFGVLLLSMIDGNLIFIGAASLSAVLLVNYFFVEPLYCFRYNKETDLTTFIMMFIMAFTISFLTGRFRKELDSNHKTAMRTDILFDCSTLLLLAKTVEDVEEIIANQFIRLLRMSVVIYRKRADGTFSAPRYFPRPGVSVSQMYPLDNDIDKAAVAAVLSDGMPAGYASKRHKGARGIYLPVKYGNNVYAAVGLFRTDGKEVPPFEFGILQSILNEAGLVYRRLSERGKKNGKNQKKPETGREIN